MKPDQIRDRLQALGKENKRLKSELERMAARLELSRLKELKLLSELCVIKGGNR